MKRTKKLFKAAAFLLAIVMVLSFASCNAAQAPNVNLEGLPSVPGINGGGSDAGIQNSKPDYGYAEDDNEAADDVVVSPEGAGPDLPEADIEKPEVDIEKPGEEDVEGDPSPEEPTPDETGEASDVPETDDPVAPITLLTGGFIKASEQPFSTFSADVDTASYTYFRKLATSGYYKFNDLRNSGADFRIEEFINYFRYTVEQPKEGELFGVKTELVPCPWDGESLLFRVTLQAEDAKPSAGNNLVFLIDVSGSMMSQDKLPLLKKAFSYLVGNLGANDTISIVTYSGKEEVVLEGCNGLNSERIMNAINSLQAAGSTNGQAGLEMAYRIAEANFIEGGNNRIIMASDGDLNVGISSASELTKFIEHKRDQGVYLSVLGFGTGNYRDENMEALADNGNGVYYYIDGESEAEKVFGTDLAGTLYTVANDVKLQMEFDFNAVDSYRLIGYDNRILDKEDFENDAKDAGDVGASHQVTVVYEVRLAEQTPGANTLGTLRVRYKNPGQPISMLNEYNISTSGAAPSEDMRFIVAVIETAALLRNREYKGNITVESIYGELTELDLDDSYKAEFREIIKDLANVSK